MYYCLKNDTFVSDVVAMGEVARHRVVFQLRSSNFRHLSIPLTVLLFRYDVFEIEPLNLTLLVFKLQFRKFNFKMTFVMSRGNIASVKFLYEMELQPQRTSPAPYVGDALPGSSAQDDRRRCSRLVDGRSNSLTVAAINEDAS